MFYLQVSLSVSRGEDYTRPEPFSNFKSNLGSQQLVDVAKFWIGSRPQEIAPGSIPLGSLTDKNYIFADRSQAFLNDGFSNSQSRGVTSQSWQPSMDTGEDDIDVLIEASSPKWVGPRPEYLVSGIISLGSLSNQKILPKPNIKGGDDHGSFSEINYSIFTNTRPYFTSNVFRSKSDQDSAGVFENTFGGTISFPVKKMGSYLTMVPRLDFILVASAYEKMEFNAHEDLESIFGLIKSGLNFEFPNDFIISSNLEFNSVRNLNSGKKIFDAWVPSISFSKIFGLSDTTILVFGSSLRQSYTKKKIDNLLPGISDNDGDNFQFGVNMSLLKILGENGQFVLMPSIGINRTEYQRHEKDGFVHWTSILGFNASWQIREWLSFDFGATLTLNQSNEEISLNPGAEYEALEFGSSVMSNFSF